jgi:hypothetical protein
MAQKRDEKNEVPANFSDHVNLLVLESITYIALDRRLGILEETKADENAKQLIKVTDKLS